LGQATITGHTVANDQGSTVTVSADTVGAAAVLTVTGRLDASTYLLLRDTIIKAALDEPEAVIVDISGLEICTESALAVFTSARWQVSRWPEVPIVLVSDHYAIRRAIVRNGVSRYVPVHATVPAALAEPGRTPSRRRAHLNLLAEPASLMRSRDAVTEWLTAWSQADLIPVAKVIVTALVENVLAHTDSAPSVRLETDGSTVTVAVEDFSRATPSVPETPSGRAPPSGLRIVAALCRTWGNSPTPSGKTVWAIVGPENRL
jgi:anti-anti-sigma factor